MSGESLRLLRDSEIHVASLIALGMTNQEISDIRGTSCRTTKQIVSQLFSKLGVNNRVKVCLCIISGKDLSVKKTAIANMYCAGVSPSVIADSVGLTDVAVRRFLDSEAIPNSGTYSRSGFKEWFMKNQFYKWSGHV